MLQGFPDNFKLPSISDSELYHQAGNSVTVPVVQRIAKSIMAVLERSKSEEIEIVLPINISWGVRLVSEYL